MAFDPSTATLEAPSTGAFDASTARPEFDADTAQPESNDRAPTTVRSDEEPSLIGSIGETYKDFGKALVRGTGGVVKAIAGATEMPTDPISMASDLLTDAGLPQVNTMGRRRDATILNWLGDKITKSVGEKETSGFNPTSAKWWAENLPEVVPQLAAQLGLAVLTKGGSLPAFMASGGMMMAGPQYQDSLEDSRKKGLPENVARARALAEGGIVGTLGAALERIPGAEYLTKGPIAKFVGNVIGDSRVVNFVAKSGAEGLTEVAQELTSIITESAVRGEKVDVEKAKARLLASGVLGAAAGGGASIALGDSPATPSSTEEPAPEPTPTTPTPPAPTAAPSTETPENNLPKTGPEVVSPTDITSQTTSIQPETEASRSWEMAKKEMAAVANEAPPAVAPLTERHPVEPPPDFPLVDPEAKMEQVAASEPPPVAPITPEPEPVISQAPPVEAGPVGPQPSPDAVQEREPAAAGAAAPEGQIGVRNAITDQVAKAMGLPERVTPQTYGAEQQLADAQAEIAKNPKRGEELVAETAEKPRPLTTLETNVVLYELAARKTAFNQAVERVNAATTADARATAEADVRKAREGVQQAIEATRAFGTEQGRALEARKRLIAEQYELPIMQAELQAAKGDDELTKEEAQKVTEISEGIKKADAEADAIEEQNAKTDAEALFQNLLVEEGKTAQQQAKAGKTLLDSLKAGHDEALKNIRRRMGQTNAGVDPTVLYDVARIGAYHIANGAKKLSDFTKKVIEEVGEWIRPNIAEIFNRSKEIHSANQSAFGTPAKTKRGRKPVDVAALAAADAEKGELSHRTAYEVVRQKIQQGVEGFDNVMQAATDDLAKLIPGTDLRAVRTAFSEYGKTQFPSQEDLAKTLSEYRRLGQLSEAIADVQEGKPPKKSGPQRNKPTQNVRELEAKLRVEMDKAGIETQSEEDQIASRNQARVNLLKNQIADLDKQLQTGQKREKGKPVPDTDEVERLKAERNAMLDEVARLEAEANPPKTEAEKQIERLEKTKAQVDEVLQGTREQKPAKQFEALSEKADQLKAEIDEMRKLAAQMKRDAKPKAEPAARKEQAQIKALEKAIDEYSRRVREGDLASKPKTTTTDSARVKALKDIRDSRRSMYEVAKKAGKPVKTETEKRIEAAQRAIDKSIAETERRIREKDFTPKPKRIPVETKALLDARAKSAELKMKYEEMRADFEFKNLPKSQQLWFGAKQGLRAYVNILSSMDLSAPRQAAGYMLNTLGRSITNPAKAGQMAKEPFVRMFQALWDEKLASRIDQQIKDRPNYKNGIDKLSGVQFQDVNSPTFTKGEENAFSILDKWAKIPYKRGNLAKTIAAAPFLAGAKSVRASNRAFATFLNVARAMMLDEVAAITFKDRKPTPQQIRLIGDAVNLATGRSNVPQGAKTGLRYSGLWSPDLFLSRVQGLLGQPLISAAVRGEGRVTYALAKEYARTILGGYMLLMLSRLFSDDDEKGKSKAVTTPTSSDYGKAIRTGETADTRVDPFGGFQQPVVAAARLATSEKTNINGETKELKARDKALLLFNLYRSKLRPTVGVALDAILGEDYGYKDTRLNSPEGRANLAKKLVPVPLAWQEASKLFREHGLSEAAALQALQLFGWGVNNYAEDEGSVKPSR